MRKASLISLVTLTVFAFGLKVGLALGQNNDNQAPAGETSSSSSIQSSTAVSPVVIPPDDSIRRFSAVSAGVTIGTQIIGVEAATPLANRFNLRGGANLFSYSSGNVTIDSNTYSGALSLRSVQAQMDWFPFGSRYWSFHLTPGVMLYNGTKATATLQVATGTSVALNGVTYYSDPSDPLGLSGKVTFPTSGPQFTVGFGDMVPRKPGKHFSTHSDFGFAYFGNGTTSLNVTGSECTSYPATSCQEASADPIFQTNLAAKQAMLEKDVTKYARFYPILSEGFSYKF